MISSFRLISKEKHDSTKKNQVKPLLHVVFPDLYFTKITYK